MISQLFMLMLWLLVYIFVKIKIITDKCNAVNKIANYKEISTQRRLIFFFSTITAGIVSFSFAALHGLIFLAMLIATCSIPFSRTYPSG